MLKTRVAVLRFYFNENFKMIWHTWLWNKLLLKMTSLLDFETLKLRFQSFCYKTWYFHSMKWTRFFFFFFFRLQKLKSCDPNGVLLHLLNSVCYTKKAFEDELKSCVKSGWMWLWNSVTKKTIPFWVFYFCLLFKYPSSEEEEEVCYYLYNIIIVFMSKTSLKIWKKIILSVLKIIKDSNRFPN